MSEEIMTATEVNARDKEAFELFQIEQNKLLKKYFGVERPIIPSSISISDMEKSND